MSEKGKQYAYERRKERYYEQYGHLLSQMKVINEIQGIDGASQSIHDLFSSWKQSKKELNLLKNEVVALANELGEEESHAAYQEHAEILEKFQRDIGEYISKVSSEFEQGKKGCALTIIKRSSQDSRWSQNNTSSRRELRLKDIELKKRLEILEKTRELEQREFKLQEEKQKILMEEEKQKMDLMMQKERQKLNIKKEKQTELELNNARQEVLRQVPSDKKGDILGSEVSPKRNLLLNVMTPQDNSKPTEDKQVMPLDITPRHSIVEKNPEVRTKSNDWTKVEKTLEEPPARQTGLVNSLRANEELVNAIANLAEAIINKLPGVEPDVFSGDVFEYPHWLSTFESVVEANYPSPAERLFYLKRYTDGEAKKSIEGIYCLDIEYAYVRAKDILEKRFGDKLVLTLAYLDKLRKWPNIKEGNQIELRKFSDFLNDCELSMGMLPQLKILEYVQEQKKIIEKLPSYIQNRWLRYIHKDREDVVKDYPPFSKLCKFVENEAEENINGVLCLKTEDTYIRPKEMLEERFDDKVLLAWAYLDKLRKWPDIKEGNHTGLRKFSDFLTGCEVAMGTLAQLKVLDYVQEQKMIINKLPSYIQDELIRCIYNQRKDGVRDYPPFSKLCKFIKNEAEIACFPLIFSTDVSRKGMSKTAKQVGPNRRSYFASHTNENLTKTHAKEKCGSLSKNGATDQCVLCKSWHDLDECAGFKRMILAERTELVRKCGLCWSCLKGGHKSRYCRHRKKCSICNGNHPTLLHNDSQRVKEKTTLATSRCLSH